MRQSCCQHKLFASIMVTYHNTLGTDLFDVEPTSYVVTMTDGSTVEVEGSTPRERY
jgi:hypothetical protein